MYLLINFLTPCTSLLDSVFKIVCGLYLCTRSSPNGSKFSAVSLTQFRIFLSLLKPLGNMLREIYSSRYFCEGNVFSRDRKIYAQHQVSTKINQKYI